MLHLLYNAKTDPKLIPGPGWNRIRKELIRLYWDSVVPNASNVGCLLPPRRL